MKKVYASALALATFCTALHFSTAAIAGEADVKRALEAKIGKVEKLAKSPVGGLWEAVIGGQVFYADDSGQYAFIGNLIEVKSGRNLTSEKQFSMMPLSLAIKQVRGNGKNVLVTFEDPNCGYCKKLAKDMQKLKNVTLYTFLYPVLGEDSAEKSKAIWCAADKAKAWNDWMINNKSVGTAPEKCDLAGLDASVELGRKLRINGTPALFFGNGERVGGYIPVEEIEKRFAASDS